MKTINEVIEKLKQANPENDVFFSPLRLVPTTVDSWRGIYAEPALGWEAAGYSGNGKAPTVATLLAELEKSIDGREYQGWKGGEYTYRGNSPLHIDNPGESTNTEIQDVIVGLYDVTIVIATEE